MHERNCVCMFLSLKVTGICIIRMHNLHMYNKVTVLKSKYDNKPKNA